MSIPERIPVINGDINFWASQVRPGVTVQIDTTHGFAARVTIPHDKVMAVMESFINAICEDRHTIATEILKQKESRS